MDRPDFQAEIRELNLAYLMLAQQMLRSDRATLDRGALIETVKKQAVMIFGAAQVTLLRDEAYNFLQLGAFLERGSNSRIDYRPVHEYTLTDDIKYIEPKARVY